MLRLIALLSSFMAVWLKLLMPGGVRAIAAENIALRKQLLVLARCQKRCPKLSIFEKITFGLLVSMLSQKRLLRIAMIMKPATLLKFHKALIKRKYHLLYSKKTSKKPGPKGPEQAVIDAVIEMKRRNPRFGHRRIAMQLSNAFGLSIDKDVVRRILNKYFKNNPKDQGPSWLTFLGYMKDSLWSLNLFMCESLHLKTHGAHAGH